MSLEVIGAGYGRTGTKSLQVALEMLCGGNCYHMEELIANPHGVRHWEAAQRDEDPEWDVAFDGYKAIVDFPGSMHYKKLASHYPEAKVVLSVRDAEKWYQSALHTIYAFDPGMGVKLRLLASLPFSSRARHMFRVIQLIQKGLWGEYFEGRFEDPEYTIGRFNSHIDEVKNTIPENRLLVYDVREGWEPLCAFLGKPVPDEPFPVTNKKEDFREMSIRIVKESLRG